MKELISYNGNLDDFNDAKSMIPFLSVISLFGKWYGDWAIAMGKMEETNQNTVYKDTYVNGMGIKVKTVERNGDFVVSMINMALMFGPLIIALVAAADMSAILSKQLFAGPLIAVVSVYFAGIYFVFKGGEAIEKGNQKLIEKKKSIGMIISIIGILFSLDIGYRFASAGVLFNSSGFVNFIMTAFWTVFVYAALMRPLINVLTLTRLYLMGKDTIKDKLFNQYTLVASGVFLFMTLIYKLNTSYSLRSEIGETSEVLTMFVLWAVGVGMLYISLLAATNVKATFMAIVVSVGLLFAYKFIFMGIIWLFDEVSIFSTFGELQVTGANFVEYFSYPFIALFWGVLVLSLVAPLMLTKGKGGISLFRAILLSLLCLIFIDTAFDIAFFNKPLAIIFDKVLELPQLLELVPDVRS